jgi:hypothetical protein
MYNLHCLDGWVDGYMDLKMMDRPVEEGFYLPLGKEGRLHRFLGFFTK